jgi:hypothetical protein
VNHFTITDSKVNKDIPDQMADASATAVKEYYLELYGDFDSRMPDPSTLVEPVGDKFVVRCDKGECGFKAYAAEQVVIGAPSDRLVYCAPRVGHAAEALCVLAQMYGKKLTFFCPASKQVSNHQAVLAAYGADLRFVKIAAMPVLNSYAKKWASENGAHFLPFGLSGLKQVTAGIVKFADRIARVHGEPKEFWCATSTGTMIRGLQIGWPNSIPMSVAVARNMHDGEIGRAVVISADQPFLAPAKVQPPFPTTSNYDAKAWEPFTEVASPGSYFINVGSDESIEKKLHLVDKSKIDSNREWHDHRDLASI